MTVVYFEKIKKYEKEALTTNDNINELRVAEVKDMERKILEFKQASEQEYKQIYESYKNKKTKENFQSIFWNYKNIII